MTDTLAGGDTYARLRTVVQRFAAHPQGPRLLADFAEGLDPEDLGMLERVVADLGEHWRGDPVSTAAHLTKNEPAGVRIDPYPYAQLLGRKWAQLDDGTDPYQIWNLPAQYGKSTVGQWGLAWSLDRHPAKRYITTSYGDELADRNGLATRDILEGHPDTFSVRLRRDQRRKDRFLTSQGGGLLAAGIFAGMTGWGAHGIVVDDPFKGWEQAHSAAHRKKVWDTYRSVVWLRRSSDDAWVLVIMTRWHEEDLTGMLVDAGERDLGVRFTVTRLPELAEEPQPDAPNPVLREPDPLRRAPGEPLEPRRFSLAGVLAKHKVLGTYLTAGMAQQRPAPEEGTEIKRAWFGIEATLPARPDEALSAWDLKMKDKESGDYVAGGMWWRVGGGYWLVEVLRGQWNQATTANAIALMAVRHPYCRRHVLEAAGNAPEVKDELAKARKGYVIDDDTADKLGMNVAERAQVQRLRRRGMSGLQLQPVKGDKQVRMRAEVPVVEAGDVRLPAGARWVPLYLEEMAAFPNGAHDDQVDMTSLGLSKLAHGPGGSAVPEGTVPKPDPRRRATGTVLLPNLARG